MRRMCAVAVGLALLLTTPGFAAADTSFATHQQAINFVIARALSQRGVPYAYGGGNTDGPSLGTVEAPTAAGVTPDSAAGSGSATSGLSLVPGATAGTYPAVAPAPAPRVSAVGFDSSGLIVYAFAGAGIKMPRSSGEQYKVGRKILPSEALPGDLIFFGPDGTQSVALFVGNGQMIEATVPNVVVSPVRTAGMTPYLTRIIEQ